MLTASIMDGEFCNEEGYVVHQQSDVVEKIQKQGRVPKMWTLLDNQSTVDVFHNSDLLTNSRQNNGCMDHCNAGVTIMNMADDLPGYGQVWYHPRGITNIMPLKRVKSQGHHITYDSAQANEFHVHKPDGTIRVFQESPRGLYYSDTDTHKTRTLFVNTVAGSKSKYTNRDYLPALLARKTQKMIGHPSTHSYIAIVENNLLPNCPVTRRNIMIAEDIFRPNVRSLKGKTVRRGAPPCLRVDG
jgi:hypothetical protein